MRGAGSFQCLALLWVRGSNLWTRFAQTKLQAAEQSLASAHGQFYFQFRLEPETQRWAVPEIGLDPSCSRSVSQDEVDSIQMLACQLCRTTAALAFAQAGQAPLLEAVDPILDGPRRIPQQFGHLSATEPFGD